MIPVERTARSRLPEAKRTLMRATPVERKPRHPLRRRPRAPLPVVAIRARREAVGDSSAHQDLSQLETSNQGHGGR